MAEQEDPALRLEQNSGQAIFLADDCFENPHYRSFCLKIETWTSFYLSVHSCLLWSPTDEQKSFNQTADVYQRIAICISKPLLIWSTGKRVARPTIYASPFPPRVEFEAGTDEGKRWQTDAEDRQLDGLERWQKYGRQMDDDRSDREIDTHVSERWWVIDKGCPYEYYGQMSR